MVADTRWMLLLLLASMGCLDLRRPELTFEGDWQQEDMDRVWGGTLTWSEWFPGDMRPITVRRVKLPAGADELLYRVDAAGAPLLNPIVYIDSRWRGWDLQSVAAHEMGHMLFYVDHLPTGEVGIMKWANPEGPAAPTPDDLRLIGAD